MQNIWLRKRRAQILVSRCWIEVHFKDPNNNEYPHMITGACLAYKVILANLGDYVIESCLIWYQDDDNCVPRTLIQEWPLRGLAVDGENELVLYFNGRYKIPGGILCMEDLK